MRSITIAVIFAGLISIWGGYAPQNPEAKDDQPIAVHSSPMSGEPDDDEDDDRVIPRRRKNEQ